MLAKHKIREFRLKKWLDVIQISTSSFWWPTWHQGVVFSVHRLKTLSILCVRSIKWATALTWTCLPLPKNPEEVVSFRFECPLLSPDPILGYSATRVCQSLLYGLLLNALFGSIFIKCIHLVCVQINTEVFPSVSNNNYNKILKSDWLSTALISAYVSCRNNSTVRAITVGALLNGSCPVLIITTTKFSNLIGYQLPWFQRTCHA